MSAYFHVSVPVEGTDGKTRYRRVGVLFQNEAKSGETYFTLELDFPVGVTKLLCFAPRDDARDDARDDPVQDA